MMFENRIKTCLAAGRPALGAAAPDSSEIVAKLTINSGIDFLWIDLEHRSYGTHEVRWLPILCRQADCSAMVRVPGLDPMWIKKALDIGANTVMVPQINNADEARRAVEYAKYPPGGSRGVSPTWTLLMDVSWDDYLPAANDETCVVVQIETPEAMENVEEIAAVDGVDVVFAGPADLSASLGVIGQTDHPELLDFLASFPARVAAQGKTAGVTFADLERCERARREGYQFVNVGSILNHGIGGLQDALAHLREM
ncbi:MAG: aldolase/citrate lyase family protein [Pirellulaceae bacterium]|nr:aldolase/citrate lyase family protein [Pirellulaceae bacterium]MDP7015410.1 aldolase/citrate lyase family protein [Pirellulaceae bacterium]